MSQTLFWISVGFAIFFVLFLVYAYLKADTMNRGRWQLLRLLSSLCMGFAGGLFTGSVIFQGEVNVSLGKFTISAVGGFAAWAIIWFTFGSFVHEPNDDHRLALPSMTFENAAKTIAKSYNATIIFTGFSPTELTTKLQAYELRTKTIPDTFLALRNITKPGTTIRPYEVIENSTGYELKI